MVQSQKLDVPFPPKILEWWKYEYKNMAHYSLNSWTSDKKHRVYACMWKQTFFHTKQSNLWMETLDRSRLRWGGGQLETICSWVLLLRTKAELYNIPTLPSLFSLSRILYLSSAPVTVSCAYRHNKGKSVPGQLYPHVRYI